MSRLSGILGLAASALMSGVALGGPAIEDIRTENKPGPAPERVKWKDRNTYTPGSGSPIKNAKIAQNVAMMHEKWRKEQLEPREFGAQG